MPFVQLDGKSLFSRVPLFGLLSPSSEKHTRRNVTRSLVSVKMSPSQARHSPASTAHVSCTPPWALQGPPCSLPRGWPTRWHEQGRSRSVTDAFLAATRAVTEARTQGQHRTTLSPLWLQGFSSKDAFHICSFRFRRLLELYCRQQGNGNDRAKSLISAQFLKLSKQAQLTVRVSPPFPQT